MGIRDTIRGAIGNAAQTIANFASVGGSGTPVQRSQREKKLQELDDLYRGRQYDNKGLSPSWDKLPPGRYVRMQAQRPSALYDLPRLVVDRPTAMLFGEGRFPEIALTPKQTGTDVADVNAWLTAIVEEGALQHVALIWARQGGRIGTAVMTWAIVEGEFTFEAHMASQCTPTFHKKKRDRLIGLEKLYKFKKTIEKVVDGITVDVEADFWHRETWDEKQHTVYEDEPAIGENKPTSWTVLAEDGVAKYSWGRCPAVWVKNLDEGEPSNIDGISLNDGLADLVEDIDRTLSQKARAVRYNQDPERVYYGLTEDQAKKIHGGGGATTSLPAKPGSDVSLVEMNGEGQRVAEEHINSQRGRALETARVVSPNPDTLLAASKSGAALRILFSVMLELVGELRQTYGRGLKDIMSQIVEAARKGKLSSGELGGALTTPPPDVIPDGKLSLTWGRAFDPTPDDLFTLAQAVNLFSQSKMIDHETILRCIAAYVGIKDVEHVMEAAQKENEEAMASEYGMMTGVGGKPKAKAGKGAPGDGAAADTSAAGGSTGGGKPQK